MMASAARCGRLRASRVLGRKRATVSGLSLQVPIPAPLPDAEPSPASVSAFNLPNTITASRIVVSPLLGWLVLHEHYTAALVGCAAAAASDLADGYIARRWGLETVLGSYLDPLADKLFMGSMCVSLAAVGALEPRLAALVVARDVVLVAGTGVTLWEHTRHAGATSPTECVRLLVREPLRVHPTLVSKLTIGVQVMLVGASLAHAGHWVDDRLIYPLSLAVALCTCASAASYAPVMAPVLRRWAATRPRPRAADCGGVAQRLR